MAHKSTITCKAAVAWAPGEPLVLEQIEVHPPMAGEVRVKITHTSLCQTDITFWKEKEMEPLFPRIFGHEAAGVVESVGDGVVCLAPGDKVIPIFTGECRTCKYCTSDKTNLCRDFRVDPSRPGIPSNGGSRFSKDGVPINHFMGTSTFSEYTVVHEHCLVKIDPQAPLDKVCLLSCGVTTGLGAVWNCAKVEAGATVAIFGLGTIGLAIAEAAKLAGASRIIGIDVNPAKHELGKHFGLTHFVNPRDHDAPIEQVLMELTECGVDYSFECVGSVSLMEAAIECTHDGWGTTIIVGVPSSKSPLCSNPVRFLFGQVVKGTILGGYRTSQVAGLVDKYMNKEIKLDEFITHEMPFERINDAMQLLIKGDCLRCVLHMDSSSNC